MSLLAGVRGAVGGALRKWGQLTAANSWQFGARNPRMAKVAISIGENGGRVYSLPERNLGKLKQSVTKISQQSGVPIVVARRFGTCPFDSKGTDFLAKDVITTILKAGDKITTLELEAPAEPLSLCEIRLILKTMANIKSIWHSVILLPPDPDSKNGFVINSTKGNRIEEVTQEIKENGGIYSYAFFGVEMERGSLVRLLDQAFKAGYSVQMRMDPPPEPPEDPLYKV